MRKLIWPVLFLFLLLIQGAFSVFYHGWLSCDLMLLAVYSCALLRGVQLGVSMGAFAGLLQDAMSVGVFGFHILTRACVGYFIGLTTEKIFKDNLCYHMGVIALISAAVRFAYWWIELLRANGNWLILDSYIWESLGFIAGNVILIVPMLIMVNNIYEWIKEEDISY